MLIDLHCHSYLSTGCNLDPRAVLDRAASHGLDGVAFTETNTQDGCDELFHLGRGAKVRALGAAIVAARPYDRDFPYPAQDYILSLKSLCAVEGYNPRIRSSANDLAVEAAEKMSLPCAGGSDARASLDEVGWGATLFKREVETQEQLVQGLLAGEFWAVQMGEL